MNALSPRRRLVDSVSSLAPADAYGRLQRRQDCRLHLLRAALGAALQASDESKRDRASACNNDARCRLQRSEHSDATRSRLAKHASAMRDGKLS